METREKPHNTGSERPVPLLLSGKQRRVLRALAHRLSPVVLVGEAGITDEVVRATEEALATHELIKVRLQRPVDKRYMAAELAERSRSTLCGLVGHVVILYKPHPENPRIQLAGLRDEPEPTDD